MKQYDRSVFIFHRDLRIQDNTGLNEALKQSNKVYLVFIMNSIQLFQSKNSYKSNKSVQCMIESLFELSETIHDLKGVLSVLFEEGKTFNILKQYIQQEKIECIFTNRDYTPYAKQREILYKEIASKLNIEYKGVYDYNLFQPGMIQTGSNEGYKKFTPFYNNCISNASLIPKPYTEKHTNSFIDLKQMKNTTKKMLVSLKDMYLNSKIVELSSDSVVQGGRLHALHILRNIKDWKKYDSMRNYLTYDTTILSPYIKYGCVSIRECFFSMKQNLGIQHSLLRQLFWNEFYAQLLDNNPQLIEKGVSLKPKYDKIQWNTNTKWIECWKNGTTGIPIVDACMKQMNVSGYMHNRGRLIVAECLVKLMGIDWRVGEKYFATKLIDYDVASNNGNWQWVAGSGADSQPYFRIMNIWKQGEKYDPNAEYIKRWMPILKPFTPKQIHTWYETSENKELLKEKGFNIHDYSTPIFDYSKQRKKVLSMYKKIF